MIPERRKCMGKAGVEPARGITPGDFKSPASAIPPLAQVLSGKDLRYQETPRPASWAQIRTRAASSSHLLSRVQLGDCPLGDFGDLAGVVLFDDPDGAPAAQILDGAHVYPSPLSQGRE